jgi:hypothetical protein
MDLRSGLSRPASRLPERLDEDWPELRLLVSTRMRRACERRLGLPGTMPPDSPAGTDVPLHMPG